MTRIPGTLLCLAVGAACYGISHFVPALSALLIAIIAGIIVAHAVTMPETARPGIAFSAKILLRLGIILLGFQLVLGDIIALGWGVLAVVILIVAGGLAGTVVIGRRLGMSRSESILIGSGFSICGAAAVAGVESTIRRKDEEVATAIALVVIFGTAMIGIMPLILGAVPITDAQRGYIAGGSIHEVAQVVAVGGILGGSVLTSAVLVKLARVLMLAPVVTVLGALERRGGAPVPSGKVPPLVPPFIIGFLAAALARTFLDIPDPVLGAIKIIQTILLAAAMFALGLGVHVSMLKKAGAKPFVLGALSTCLVSAIAAAGMLLVS
ncbi:MAG: putative sulfate exporter family transporter [Flaviflexus sp.]|nr:putative sulfate exporter family transporter [Flaviflexus sp.]